MDTGFAHRRFPYYNTLMLRILFENKSHSKWNVKKGEEDYKKV